MTAAPSIAVDSAGQAYVTGLTKSTDFPVLNPLQPALRGSQNAFVTKFNASGSAFVYSTYLGGTTIDAGNGIAVDSLGNAYITGVTQSNDFPTKNAFQATFGGDHDAFVAKLNPSGSALVYSTYLGGTGWDVGNAIAVNSSTDAFVTGYTQSIADFPLMNPLQPRNDIGESAFVTKLNHLGSLAYSTYFGGANGSTQGAGIALDTIGNAYITGTTFASDLPVMNALQPTYGGALNFGGGDAFVSVLSPLGSALVYSSFLGGSFGDMGLAIAVDGASDVYLAGVTSSIDFPTLNALQPAAVIAEQNTGFVTKMVLNGTGTTLQLSQAEWTFPPHVVGSPSGNAFISVKNTGSTPASFLTSSLTSTLPGLQFATTCASPLEPGVTCKIQFSYVPQTLGASHGTLSLFSNAADNPNVIQINGVGFGVHTSSSSWSFSPRPAGTTSPPGTIYLTNKSSTPMDLLSTVSITGPNASDFSLTNGCTAAVAPYTTCELTFTWLPQAPGFRHAQITITSPAVQNGLVIIPINAKAL